MSYLGEAPEWATHVMKNPRASSWEYFESESRYQGISYGSIHENCQETKRVTKDWIRMPITRQLEND